VKDLPKLFKLIIIKIQKAFLKRFLISN